MNLLLIIIFTLFFQNDSTKCDLSAEVTRSSTSSTRGIHEPIVGFSEICYAYVQPLEGDSTQFPQKVENIDEEKFKNFELVLKLDKETYQVDETIKICFGVKNISEQDQKVGDVYVREAFFLRHLTLTESDSHLKPDKELPQIDEPPKNYLGNKNASTEGQKQKDFYRGDRSFVHYPDTEEGDLQGRIPRSHKAISLSQLPPIVWKGELLTKVLPSGETAFLRTKFTTLNPYYQLNHPGKYTLIFCREIFRDKKTVPRLFPKACTIHFTVDDHYYEPEINRNPKNAKKNQSETKEQKLDFGF